MAVMEEAQIAEKEEKCSVLNDEIVKLRRVQDGRRLLELTICELKTLEQEQRKFQDEWLEPVSGGSGVQQGAVLKKVYAVLKVLQDQELLQDTLDAEPRRTVDEFILAHEDRCRRLQEIETDGRFGNLVRVSKTGDQLRPVAGEDAEVSHGGLRAAWGTIATLKKDLAVTVNENAVALVKRVRGSVNDDTFSFGVLGVFVTLIFSAVAA